MKSEFRRKYCRINQLDAEFQAIPTMAGSLGMTMPMLKKFNTALSALSDKLGNAPARSILGLGLVLQACALQAFIAVASPAAAQPFGPTSNPTFGPPGGPSERVAAPAPKAGDQVFVPNAPDRHTVVKGDTLWGISAKYLQKPWQWPQIWQMNREQIRNPHLIYPGQLILLNKETGTMSLAPTPQPAQTEPVTRLSPSIRSEVESLAIPSIPADAIEPFLTQPVLIDPQVAQSAPRVIGSAERVLLSAGDEIYAAGAHDPKIVNYNVYRPGKTLRDPENNEILGYEAVYLGAARVTRQGDPFTLQINSTALEISIGDRLVAAMPQLSTSYVPRSPDKDISGRIVSIYGGVAKAGRDQIVALNRGATEGVEPGHVFVVQTFGRTIVDRSNGSPQEIRLPDEVNGMMFVFRVFDKVSYALIMNVTGPVTVGDRFKRP